MPVLKYAQNYNPIQRRELIYQARTLPGWLRYEARYLLLLGTVLFLLGWAAPRDLYIPLPIWIAWMVHALVVLRGLLMGASLISREHESQTWEALILTGVSARQVFFGKLGAAMYRARWWMIWLGAVWFGMAITAHFENTISSTGTFHAEWIALDPLMLFILCPLELFCSTALGIAASAITRRRTSAIVLAAVIRFAPVFFFSITAFTINSETLYFFNDLSLADGGTLALLGLMTRIDSEIYPHVLIGLLLSILLLSFLLTGAVLTGLFALRRSGASTEARESARSV